MLYFDNRESNNSCLSTPTNSFNSSRNAPNASVPSSKRPCSDNCLMIWVAML